MDSRRARDEENGGRALATRSFRANPLDLRSVRRFIRELATAATFREEATADLVLAVSEAAANSAVHSKSRRIVVTWRPMERGAEISIMDEGVFSAPPRRSQEGRVGLGLPVIQALCDEVTIQPGTAHRPGTKVRLVKYKR